MVAWPGDDAGPAIARSITAPIPGEPNAPATIPGWPIETSDPSVNSAEVGISGVFPECTKLVRFDCSLCGKIKCGRWDDVKNVEMWLSQMGSKQNIEDFEKLDLIKKYFLVPDRSNLNEHVS